jgi:CRP-like cAMP-binding protein
MEKKLINYFSKITTLSLDEIKTLTDTMVIKKFKKDTYLLKEGQADKDTYFILEGLVRQYKMLDGEEITTKFFVDEQWIISLTSFVENTVAEDNLVCIEDTTVVIGNEQKAQELFKQYPRFETISRIVMETVFSEKQKEMSFYLTDTPEQRYLRLLKTKPDLIQRVPQYQLASYIGVKPESLSRIRKRMALK